jgi:hypothetical protein
MFGNEYDNSSHIIIASIQLCRQKWNDVLLIPADNQISKEEPPSSHLNRQSSTILVVIGLFLNVFATYQNQD